MKKHRFMIMALAAGLALVSVGCTKDKDEKEGIDFKTHELSATAPIEITHQNDAAAAYPVSLRISLEDGKLVAKGLSTDPTEAAISQGLTGNKCTNAAVVADYGKAKSLSAIETIPVDGDFSQSVTLATGEGYVFEVHGTQNVASYGNPNIKDPGKMYVRLCVLEEVSAGTFSVKYQYPFVVE